MLDHAWMMVTVRVADSGRVAPPSRGGVNNARRRRKFCEGRGENGHFLWKKTGGKVEFHRVGCSLHCNAVLLLIACYPGNGARYVKHVDDALAHRGRRLTCIAYANPEW